MPVTKQTTSAKKSSSSTVEPVIISRLQRTTAAQIARERARAMWRQRASRILLGAVVTAVALRVVTIAAQPCLAAYRSSREIKQLRVHLHQEKQRQKNLHAQIAFLKSDLGVEEEARRLGWTRIGEVSLQFITPEPPPPPQAGAGNRPAATADTPNRISVSERIRVAVTRWLEGQKRSP